MWQRGIDVSLTMRSHSAIRGTARLRTGQFLRIKVGRAPAVHRPTRVVHECAILPLMPAAFTAAPVSATP